MLIYVLMVCWFSIWCGSQEAQDLSHSKPVLVTFDLVVPLYSQPVTIFLGTELLVLVDLFYYGPVCFRL